MRTGLQRLDFFPLRESTPTGPRSSRPPAPGTLAGLFAALLLGAPGVSAIEPTPPTPGTETLVSNDVIIFTGDHSMVMNVALDTTVTGNSVIFSGPGGASVDGETGSQNLHLSGSDNYSRLFGVTAVAQNSGSSVSQSVNVNAVILVELGGGTSETPIDLLSSFNPGSPPTAP